MWSSGQVVPGHSLWGQKWPFPFKKWPPSAFSLLEAPTDLTWCCLTLCNTSHTKQKRNKHTHCKTDCTTHIYIVTQAVPTNTHIVMQAATHKELSDIQENQWIVANFSSVSTRCLHDELRKKKKYARTVASLPQREKVSPQLKHTAHVEGPGDGTPPNTHWLSSVQNESGWYHNAVFSKQPCTLCHIIQKSHADKRKDSCFWWCTQLIAHNWQYMMCVTPTHPPHTHMLMRMFAKFPQPACAVLSRFTLMSTVLLLATQQHMQCGVSVCHCYRKWLEVIDLSHCMQKCLIFKCLFFVLWLIYTPVLFSSLKRRKMYLFFNFLSCHHWQRKFWCYDILNYICNMMKNSFFIEEMCALEVCKVFPLGCNITVDAGSFLCSVLSLLMTSVPRTCRQNHESDWQEMWPKWTNESRFFSSLTSLPASLHLDFFPFFSNALSLMGLSSLCCFSVRDEVYVKLMTLQEDIPRWFLFIYCLSEGVWMSLPLFDAVLL